MEPVRIPITNELHKNRKRIVAVSLAVIIVTVSVFLGLSLNSVSTINVMGIRVQFVTLGSQSGEFQEVTTHNYTWNFKSLNPQQDFRFSLRIPVSGYFVNTSGESVKVETSGFELVALASSPMPLSIGPYSNQLITMTIQAPSHDFAGEVEILVLLTPFNSF